MRIVSTLLVSLFFVGCLHVSRCEFESASDLKKNKFREREASDDNLPLPILDEDALQNTKCPQNVELRWQTEVSSSIYATPLIADINSDGKREIVVPSFVHYLEVLEGTDGDKLPGWPAFHQSTVHSSPLLYDIDKDGAREIVLATYNGEVLFFRASGYKMLDKLEVPRLRVRKDWYIGLEKDHVDRTHPDIHDDDMVREAVEKETLLKHNGNTKSNELSHSSIDARPATSGNSSDQLSLSHLSSNDTLTNVSGHNDQMNHAFADPKNLTSKVTDGVILNASTRYNLEANESAGQHLTHDGIMTDSGNKSVSTGSQRRLLEVSGSSNASITDKVATVENAEELEEDADSSFDLFREGDDGLTDEYSYDYDDYVDENAWEDEDWTEAAHPKPEDFVNVDSHILCTPVIADIDKDGVDEMIIAASYFYDPEYYDNHEHLKELGDIDISKYVSGAIVVFNLDTKQVKWSTQLDLSTTSGTFNAYIYSSPTVVDLDGDGNLDIIVGTSFGFFYVLDHHGKNREGFPLQMGEIQGQVIAADINDDGKIEMVTTDTRGNVAAWTSQGKEIWEIHLKSLIAQGPTVGDIDGDGHTDLVVPTVSGNIYVLNGKDGSLVKPFPYRTHGRVMSPVLLVDLSKRGEKQKGLTLAALSFDGYFYLIDGQTACADVVDIGETSYSMALADNVDGGDDLDFIITTMNGNVFCFSAPAPHHPLKAWTSQVQGRNNLAVRHNREGIFILQSSRAFRDEEGESFWLQFKIIDQHRVPSGNHGPYNVTVTLLVPGNYQGPRRITRSQIYQRPDTYKMKLPTVPVRTTGTVIIEMVDKNGLHFTDEFSLTFHYHFYKLFKWLLILPMLGMFGMLVIIRPQEGAPLPSFSRNMHQL